jgi:AhpD family alkylhydroperoxidase
MVYKGFAQMSRAAAIACELDTLTKELIALAISLVHGCDGCVTSHACAAAKAGASKRQAAEAIGVTFPMHGRPATIYGARANTAFCEFLDAENA